MKTLEEQAISFVIKAMEGKKRIKEDIDLSVHSITVGFMLKDLGCSETIVVSGLLHDILEDTKYTYEDIKDVFGDIIASNVLNVTEDKRIDNFRLRKEKFIANLSCQSNDIILIELADKLHNLISDYDLWKDAGGSVLSTLNTTYEDNKWYYLKMKELFNNRLSNNKLLNRYNEITDIYFLK